MVESISKLKSRSFKLALHVRRSRRLFNDVMFSIRLAWLADDFPKKIIKKGLTMFFYV